MSTTRYLRDHTVHLLKDASSAQSRKSAVRNACPSFFFHKHALARAEYAQVHALEALEMLASEERVNRGRDSRREK